MVSDASGQNWTAIPAPPSGIVQGGTGDQRSLGALDSVAVMVCLGQDNRAGNNYTKLLIWDAARNAWIKQERVANALNGTGSGGRRFVRAYSVGRGGEFGRDLELFVSNAQEVYRGPRRRRHVQLHADREDRGFRCSWAERSKLRERFTPGHLGLSLGDRPRAARTCGDGWRRVRDAHGWSRLAHAVQGLAHASRAYGLHPDGLCGNAYVARREVDVVKNPCSTVTTAATAALAAPSFPPVPLQSSQALAARCALPPSAQRKHKVRLPGRPCFLCQLPCGGLTRSLYRPLETPLKNSAGDGKSWHRHRRQHGAVHAKIKQTGAGRTAQ
jgi:hypothetical protein